MSLGATRILTRSLAHTLRSRLRYCPTPSGACRTPTLTLPPLPAPPSTAGSCKATAPRLSLWCPSCKPHAPAAGCSHTTPYQLNIRMLCDSQLLPRLWQKCGRQLPHRALRVGNDDTRLPRNNSSVLPCPRSHTVTNRTCAQILAHARREAVHL